MRFGQLVELALYKLCYYYYYLVSRCLYLPVEVFIKVSISRAF